MSCCGDKRRQFPVSASVPSEPTRTFSSYPVPQSILAQDFEYVGRTVLTVRGPITGHMYRFSQFNRHVSVDGRDVSGLTAVPHLRRVSENNL